MRDLSDQELAERCRRGDRAAQSEVYERTSGRIYRLLLRMTRNADRAFDLAQDTYVRAFTHMHQFDGRASLATWLYRIAVNQALQAARREATRATTALQRADPPVLGSGVGRFATRVDVEDALAALDPEDRAILLLRYQDGLDYATIAQITGSPRGTVASRLNRAREKVRALLGGSYGTVQESGRDEHPTDGQSAGTGEAGRVDRPLGESGVITP